MLAYHKVESPSTGHPLPPFAKQPWVPHPHTLFATTSTLSPKIIFHVTYAETRPPSPHTQLPGRKKWTKFQPRVWERKAFQIWLFKCPRKELHQRHRHGFSLPRSILGVCRTLGPRDSQIGPHLPKALLAEGLRVGALVWPRVLVRSPFTLHPTDPHRLRHRKLLEMRQRCIRLYSHRINLFSSGFTRGSTHLSPRLPIPQGAQKSSKFPTKRESYFPRVPHAGAVMAASPPKLPPSLPHLISGPSPCPSPPGGRGRLRQTSRRKERR